jgi:hypothetical protein
MKASEQSTGIESYTEYSQVWPYTGLPTKSETRLAGAGNAGVLKRTTTVYECKVPQTAAACAVGVGNRYFVYAASQTEQSWDINGVAQPTIATSSQYGINAGDSQMWGDPTRIDVVTTLGASSATKRTVNVYWPAVTDNGKWITGRLKKATVTSSVQ